MSEEVEEVPVYNALRPGNRFEIRSEKFGYGIVPRLTWHSNRRRGNVGTHRDVAESCEARKDKLLR